MNETPVKKPRQRPSDLEELIPSDLLAADMPPHIAVGAADKQQLIAKALSEVQEAKAQLAKLERESPKDVVDQWRQMVGPGLDDNANLSIDPNSQELSNSSAGRSAADIARIAELEAELARRRTIAMTTPSLDLCTDLSTACDSPAESKASIKDMFFHKKGRAKTDATAAEVFETLAAVRDHVNSDTMSRVPSTDRAALWNLWIGMESGLVDQLRGRVARAILQVANVVMETTSKGRKDSITVWIIAQLVLHLARHDIPDPRYKPLEKMDRSMKDEWEPLMFLADWILEALHWEKPFSRVQCVDALIAQNPQ